jgi:ankyrin repeat protein
MQQVVSVREIHATCEEGDVETLKKITKDIQDQDKKSYVDFGERFLDNENNHCTILHTAARYNRVNVIDYLFSLGMSLEVEDKSMATPLMYAIMRNSGDAVAHLIKKGANVNVKDYYNNPALFKSLSNKDTSIAEMLLLAGADINVKIGSNDQTMLDDACKRGDIATCGFLLNNNAFLLRKDSDDRTCLYYALQHPKIVTLLCNRAVELHQLSKLIRIMDRDKNTVMHLAVIENCKASLRILIEKAHEFNALLAEDIVNEKGKDDQTPLHYAIINNSKDIAQELINCPLINVNAQNTKGDTPMHTAIKHGNGNLLEAVLENENSHASLKIKNNDKFTPQELAKELNVDVDHVFNGFKNHRLSVMDFVGRDTIRKYRFVVFVFYRGSWSRACKNMLEKLNHIVDDVHALNGELIGVSSESAASRNVMKSLRLSYNVIDDEKGLLAKQLGVKVSKKHSAAMTGLITLLQKHNISGIMSNIEENYPNGMAQPAIVIVRRDGQVVYRWLSTPLEKNSFGMFERIEVPHIAQLIKFCKSYVKSTNIYRF